MVAISLFSIVSIAAAASAFSRPTYMRVPSPEGHNPCGRAGVGIIATCSNSIVTLATFTCQPREAVIGRRQENQWLGELQRGTGPHQNPLFLANVTMPAEQDGLGQRPMDRSDIALDGFVSSSTLHQIS